MITSQEQALKDSPCFNIQKELKRAAYSLTFEIAREHGLLFSALSDCSIVCLDLNTMQSVHHIPEAHTKRINGLHVNENLLYTCSNDGKIKIWDLRSNAALAGECKGPKPVEIYSLSQVKHVLAGGTEPDIHFWDLRNFKMMNTFGATHSEEVTSLQFHKEKASILLSGSLDGLICLFDLSKEGGEEDAAESVLRLEQPVNSCRFIGNEYSAAYAQTTVQTIALCSLEHAKVVKDVNTIENLDTNPFALLGAYDLPNDQNMYYIRGNNDGYMEEYAINLVENSPALLLNKFHSQHKGPLTKAERITEQYVISAGEDCKFCVTENIKINDAFDFDEIKKNMFLEDDDTTDSSNGPINQNYADKSSRRMRMDFDPY